MTIFAAYPGQVRQTVFKMRSQAENLIIHGNFAPSRSGRLLRMSARIFGVLFFLLIIGTLILYGVKVHFEDSINRVARTTRDLNERNKELQVKLDHICSFKNVEEAAAKVPNLHMAETRINVATAPAIRLTPLPPAKQEFLRVYGY